MTGIQALSISQTYPGEVFSIDLALLSEYIIPESLSPEGGLNWGRLICTWNEKQKTGQVITHTYAACIDGKEGTVYIDCRPGKIYLKCMASFLARPIYTLAKTIYQISLIPVFAEMAKMYRSEGESMERWEAMARAVADIILTPLYGLILTVATLAVLIVGPFAPGNLYEGRKLIGKIEQASNWGEVRTPWTLAPCFQPFSLELFEGYRGKVFDDTLYPEETDLKRKLMERELANFARSSIRYKRKVFDLFSCSKLKPGVTYTTRR